MQAKRMIIDVVIPWYVKLHDTVALIPKLILRPTHVLVARHPRPTTNTDMLPTLAVAAHYRQPLVPHVKFSVCRVADIAKQSNSVFI